MSGSELQSGPLELLSATDSEVSCVVDKLYIITCISKVKIPVDKTGRQIELLVYDKSIDTRVATTDRSIDTNTLLSMKMIDTRVATALLKHRY